MVVALTQFVDSVPQPLTDALVNLAPLLAVAARGARLLTWSDDWYASWLTLAGWWALCFASPILFRYALPIALAIVFSWAARRQRAPVVTEALLQNAITNLAILRSLPIPSTSLSPIPILRAAAILTVPWLVLSYFVSASLLLALIGTLALTHGAPWARVLRSVLWRSAFVRATLHRFLSFLTGQPLPMYIVSNHPAPTTPVPVPSLRFLFTIYENQRWWMGLDWTAALLPAERPSWCSSSLQPVSPPNAFTLPGPTTVYLPSPDNKSRIKRTATWEWDETEWRLLVRKEGSSLSRIERQPPLPDDLSTPTPSTSNSGGSRLFKAAANKFKDSPLASPPRSLPSEDLDTIPQVGSDQDDSSTEPYTDPDGWIYGDNKWENQSHRGGMSKYTRYRRWTRVATASETVEVVEPGDIGIQNTNYAPDPVPNKPAPAVPTNVGAESSTQDLRNPTASTTTLVTNELESPLRQRLRAALSKSSLPLSSS